VGGAGRRGVIVVHDTKISEIEAKLIEIDNEIRVLERIMERLKKERGTQEIKLLVYRNKRNKERESGLKY